MRSERVATHRRCNQNCTYCTERSATDDAAFVRRAAVEGRIVAALAHGPAEIVLTGGEPTLRRDLAELAAFAQHRGATRVVVETNATAIDGARARELFAHGVGRARVNLAGDGAWLDEVTRDPGGFERTLAGIDHLIASSIEVVVQAVVTRSTHTRLPELPAFLRGRFGRGVHSLVLTVPTRSPDVTELIDYDTAGRAIRAVEAQARRLGLPLKMAPDSGPPPCVHGADPRVAHLYAYTPGGRSDDARRDHRHLPACSACAVQDRCPGLPSELLARTGPPAMTPIASERARRRLSLIASVEEQIAREFVSPNRHRAAGRDVDEDIIRVMFQCNQACRFCFVSTHLPTASDTAIEDAIRAAGARGHKVTLSGGEPTLHPRIVSFVRLAKSVSSLPVLLQTNATRLGEGTLASELAAAGLDEAFVSLHGATAATSDAITEAPGTFEQTLRGLDALVHAGVGVQINFVICGRNQHELEAWVSLVAERWPSAFANVSFVAPSTDVVPRDRDLVPRYEDVLPALAAAVARAEQRGLAIGGFESMCGVPLCLVPSSLDRYFDLSAVEGLDAGEFTKPEPCTRCELASRCFGVRRGYLELHGALELRPVTS